MTSEIAPPSGTVTFLFTDIEGSTELWDRDRRAMGAAVARHDQLAREVVEEHGGYVFTTAGDSFAVAFGRAARAVSAAVGLQVRLAAEFDDGPVPLRVRMGLHCGEGEERDGDYFGPAVTRAARVMGLACGGQVLTSRAVEDLAGEELAGDGVGFVSLGEYSLRGLSRPEALFELTAPGLRTGLPAPGKGTVRIGNLPSPASSFVGRAEEISRVGAELESARMVTLVGPGGVGKTRLSIEAAAAAIDEFVDGVWFVELAPLGDDSAVVHALASALSVQPEEGNPLLDTVVTVLAQRRALIVLDNCEHVIAAAAEVASQLVTGTEFVRVLASSREPLDVPGERLWPVGPMDTGAEAVDLFVERAVAVNPGFELDADESDMLAGLCAALDGVPLAIELAAARCRSMTVSELAARLDDRFRVLRGSRRGGVDARQQTLRATVEWSYQLLEPDERLLFDRLSVFAGGFDVTATEAVCAQDQLDVLDVADLLDSLVSRSMVVADQSGGMTRFRLLETLRQFGHEQLAARDEIDPLRGCHLDHYRSVAAQARREYEGVAGDRGRRRFELDWDNLRAALEHAESAGLDEAANQIVSDTFWYSTLALVSEYSAWARRRVEVGTQLTPELLAAAGHWYLLGRDFDGAEQLARQALAAAPSPDDPSAALGWTLLMWLAHYTGRPDIDGRAADLAAKNAARQGEDRFLAAWVTALPYTTLNVAPDDASALIDEAARLAADLGNAALDSELACYAGIVHFETGHHHQALTDWRRSVELAAESGNINREAFAMASLAMRSPGITNDDPTELFVSVLQRLPRHGVRSYVPWILAGLAEWWSSHHHTEAAAHLMGFLEQHDPGGNQMVADLRSKAIRAISQDPMSARWLAQGADTSFDEIVNFALNELTHEQAPRT